MMLDLTIVVVNYKVKDFALRLLRSVLAQTKGVSFEVFFVDNASGDGSVDAVSKEFPQVKLIVNAQNLGFAKANNQAITQAVGRHILLLNPDTELTEDAPAALVRFADRHPRAGVVGCRIQNPDRTTQPSVLAFPTLCSQALILLKLHHLFPRAHCLRRYFASGFDYKMAARVEQVMGSAFLITRAALDRVGLLDERYFLWFEEVDYCKMVRDAGLEVWYSPEAVVTHHGGQSFAQVFAPDRQRNFNQSLARYFQKHVGVGAWLMIKLLHPLSMALAWGVGIFGLKRKKYA